MSTSMLVAPWGMAEGRALLTWPGRVVGVGRTTGFLGVPAAGTVAFGSGAEVGGGAVAGGGGTVVAGSAGVVAGGGGLVVGGGGTKGTVSFGPVSSVLMVCAPADDSEPPTKPSTTRVPERMRTVRRARRSREGGKSATERLYESVPPRGTRENDLRVPRDVR